MSEVIVTDYEGLEVAAAKRAVTVTVVEGALVMPTWDDLTGKPTAFPPDAHTHAYSELTGLPTIPDSPDDIGAETPAGAQAKADAAEAAANAYTDTAVDGLGGGAVDSVNAQTGVVVLDAADVGADPAGTASSAVAAHTADTTGVHGIADTSALVVTTDPRLSDPRDPTAHTHDDRYYTETEVDTALSGKAATSHTHTTAQVTGLDAALTSKAAASDLTAHTGNTSNPHAVTKAQVGLSNVDNTSDASKPVSTAQQTALDGKVTATSTLTKLHGPITQAAYDALTPAADTLYVIVG